MDWGATLWGVGARGAGVVLGAAAWLQNAPILKACRTRAGALASLLAQEHSGATWNGARLPRPFLDSGLWTLRCGELG